LDEDVFDNPAKGLTYEVVADELVEASKSVRQITASAKSGLLEVLPQLATTIGQDRLAETLAEFCARWDTGLSHLVGDGEAMSQRLTSCARNYLNNEDATLDGYQHLLSCTPNPPSQPAWIPASPNPFAGLIEHSPVQR